MVDNGKAGFARDNTHRIYEHLGPVMNLSQPMNAAANGSASTKMLNTSNHLDLCRLSPGDYMLGDRNRGAHNFNSMLQAKEARKLCEICGQLSMFGLQPQERTPQPRCSG